MRVLEVAGVVQYVRPSTPPGIGRAACLDLWLRWGEVTDRAFAVFCFSQPVVFARFATAVAGRYRV